MYIEPAVPSRKRRPNVKFLKIRVTSARPHGYDGFAFGQKCRSEFREEPTTEKRQASGLPLWLLGYTPGNPTAGRGPDARAV